MIQQPHSWAYIWAKRSFKSYTHPGVHNSTIHSSQDLEATYMFTDGGMEKDVIHIYNGILLLLLLSRISRVQLCATP